jgi:hypothetical protein
MNEQGDKGRYGRKKMRTKTMKTTSRRMRTRKVKIKAEHEQQDKED